MSWIDLPKEMVEEINAGEYDYSGDFEVVSEVAKVQVDAVFLTKSDGGAVAFNIKMKKENGAFIDAQEWVKSGDSKNNKSTYTDKKTGKEKPLPGVINVQHFLKIVGEDFKSIGEPKAMTMEVFGKVQEVKVFGKLRGRQLIVAKQAYEDEYNNEIKIRTRVVEFMDMDGNNYKGKERLSYWKEKFEKEPVKKLKVKPEKKEPDTETKSALDSW